MFSDYAQNPIGVMHLANAQNPIDVMHLAIFHGEYPFTAHASF